MKKKKEILEERTLQMEEYGGDYCQQAPTARQTGPIRWQCLAIDCLSYWGVGVRWCPEGNGDEPSARLIYLPHWSNGTTMIVIALVLGKWTGFRCKRSHDVCISVIAKDHKFLPS